MSAISSQRGSGFSASSAVLNFHWLSTWDSPQGRWLCRPSHCLTKHWNPSVFNEGLDILCTPDVASCWIFYAHDATFIDCPPEDACHISVDPICCVYSTLLPSWQIRQSIGEPSRSKGNWFRSSTSPETSTIFSFTRPGARATRWCRMEICQET